MRSSLLLLALVALAGCAPPPPLPPVVDLGAAPPPALAASALPLAIPAPTGETGLRVTLDAAGAHLFVDGRAITVDEPVARLDEVFGPPTWSKDNPPDATAMSETTYHHYSERGIAVRTKKGRIEGFYIYFEPTNLDGHKSLPAHPTLPRNLPLDATVAQSVAALGEPTVREPFAIMQWLDLHYVRGKTLFELHYDHDKLVSVKLELVPDKRR